MDRQKRIMMIGAHPDDCDFRCGGIALKYSRLGYKVKFLACCNGCGGHHILKPDEIAERRYVETQNVAKLAGIEYDVWRDMPDCEISASLENRKRLVKAIREFKPDMVFCSRLCDYHADHRNVSQLVQDASYLLTVPNYCPEVPALKEMPVIMHFYDHFQSPPFKADVSVDIDDVIENKFRLLDCHVSQVYEWLPYTKNTLDTVPEDPAARLEWLHQPRIPRDGQMLDESILNKNLIGSQCEYREAVPTVKYRDVLLRRYGEKGKKVLFSEAFCVSEYGTPLTKELEKELFPF